VDKEVRLYMKFNSLLPVSLAIKEPVGFEVEIKK